MARGGYCTRRHRQELSDIFIFVQQTSCRLPWVVRLYIYKYIFSESESLSIDNRTGILAHFSQMNTGRIDIYVYFAQLRRHQEKYILATILLLTSCSKYDEYFKCPSYLILCNYWGISPSLINTKMFKIHWPIDYRNILYYLTILFF